MNRIKCLIYSMLYNVLSSSEKYIICECYIMKKYGKFMHHNWGDDMNYYFFNYITNRKVLSIPCQYLEHLKKKNYYSLIGSILNFYSLEGKTIYGSGLIDPHAKITGKPQSIISVRGPRTRRVLIEKGIDCPEKYGDPILLLPLFYSPCRKETEKRGAIILNMGTECSEDSFVQKCCEKYRLKIISLTKYDKWTDIIDEIVNSSFVISESLHGLIVAETYGVPNVWVEFKEHPSYWNFKFEDYYESINKYENKLEFNNFETMDIIMEKISNWEKARIAYDELLSYFPFEIKCKVNDEFLKNDYI